MAIIITEDYPYANGELATVASSRWEIFSGIGGSLEVISNQLGPNSSALDGLVGIKSAAWTGQPYKQWSQVTLVTDPNFNGPGIFGDRVNNGYILECWPFASGGIIRLVKLTGGVYAPLTTLSSVTAIPNDTYYLQGKYNISTLANTLKAFRTRAGVTTQVGSDYVDSSSPFSTGTPWQRLWHSDPATRMDSFIAGDFLPELTTYLVPPGSYRKTRGIIRRGLRDDQPFADKVLEGTLYYVTDEGVTERSNGSVWEDMSDAGTAAMTQAEILRLISLRA